MCEERNEMLAEGGRVERQVLQKQTRPCEGWAAGDAWSVYYYELCVLLPIVCIRRRHGVCVWETEPQDM